MKAISKNYLVPRVDLNPIINHCNDQTEMLAKSVVKCKQMLFILTSAMFLILCLIVFFV